MKQVLTLFLAAALLTGCKGGKKASAGWPQKEKDAFTENCVNGAKGTMGDEKAKSYCDCVLGKMEAKYPDAAEAGKVDMNTMIEMAKDCVK